MAKVLENAHTAATEALTGTDISTASGDRNRTTALPAASTLVSLLTQSSDSDVRSEKIAQLKAAIAAGTYNVSAGQVADKLIEAMLG